MPLRRSASRPDHLPATIWAVCISLCLSFCLPVGSCQSVNPTRLCDCRSICLSDCLTLAVSQSFGDLLLILSSVCLVVCMSVSLQCLASVCHCLSKFGNLFVRLSQAVCISGCQLHAICLWRSEYLASICLSTFASQPVLFAHCLRVSLSLQPSVCLPLQLLRPLVCCSLGLSLIWWLMQSL